MQAFDLLSWVPKSNPFTSLIPSGQRMPVPYDEVHRLHRLHDYNIVEEDLGEQFSNVVKLAMRIFQTEIALVTVLDEADQHFKVNYGTLEGTCGTSRDVSFCTHAIMPDAPAVFVVKDAQQDARFRQNPLVIGPPNIRFYAGARLEVEDGFTAGSLCIISPHPRASFGVREQSILLSLANTISFMLRQEFKDRHRGESSPSRRLSTYVSTLQPPPQKDSSPDADVQRDRAVLPDILQYCSKALRDFYDVEIDVNPNGITNVEVHESTLRLCVVTLLTSCCQHLETTGDQLIDGVILIKAARNHDKLHVRIYDPRLRLNDIIAEDLFSSHMLSSDALLSSRWPSLGHGLLAIKERVRMCGGTCGWKRPRSGGVMFWIELPCVFTDYVSDGVSSDDSSGEQPIVGRQVQSSLFRGKNVLVLDPSTLHRATLRDSLIMEGFESANVHTASNGDEGLKMIKEGAFDVVFVDLVLPILNGLELLQELQRNPPNASQLPLVIGMSNAAENEDIATAHSHGMFAFFNKPVDVDDVFAVLSKHYEKLANASTRPPALECLKVTKKPAKHFGIRRRLRSLFKNARERLSLRSRSSSKCKSSTNSARNHLDSSSVSSDDAETTLSSTPMSGNDRASLSLYDSMAEELDFFLNTPARRSDFVRFCVYEFSAENVKFLIAVNDARRYIEKHVPHEDQSQLHSTILSMIRNIFNMYLAADAPDLVTLSSHVLQVARETYESNFIRSWDFDASEPSVALVVEQMLDWLGPAHDEIFQLVLRDTWFRFSKTDEYIRGKAQYDFVVAAHSSSL